MPMELEADVVLGMIATEEDDVETAGRLLAGAVDGFAVLGEQLLTAMASLALAAVARRRGEAARANQLVECSLAEHRTSATPILLAKALLAVTRDPVLAVRLARGAFETASEYSWDRRAARLEAVLQTAMDLQLR